MNALLPDELWAKVEPLLPRPRRRRLRHPGRKPLDRPRVLTGTLLVLRAGIRWNDLPSELGWGSGSRCRRHLSKWHRAGVWRQLHALLLAELDDSDQIDWSRAAVDSLSFRIPGGGESTGNNPTDRGRPGSKRHAVVDGHGIPLGATTTSANVPDAIALPVVRPKRRERRKRRPKKLYADRPTTRSGTAGGCVGGGSSRYSPGGERRTAAGGGGTPGRSSGSSRGCTTTDG